MIKCSIRTVGDKVSYLRYVHDKCGHAQVMYGGVTPYICQEAGCNERLPNLIALLGKSGLESRIKFYTEHKIDRSTLNFGLGNKWGS